MDNEQYVQSLGIDEQAQRRCLEVMEKYGDNHWWESDIDPRTFAYFQLREGVMLSDGKRFQQAVQTLCNRVVSKYELIGSAYQALLEETERAWRWGVGCTSEQEASDRLVDGLKRAAADYPENLIVIDLRSRESEGE